VGARGGAVGCSTSVQAGRSRVRLPMISLDFIRPLYGSGFDSDFNRNEYQEYLLGEGGGGGGG